MKNIFKKQVLTPRGPIKSKNLKRIEELQRATYQKTPSEYTMKPAFINSPVLFITHRKFLVELKCILHFL